MKISIPPIAGVTPGQDARFTTPASFTIGDGATLGPYTIQHNMGTRAFLMSVRQKRSPFKEIRLIDVAHPSINALQILTDGKALPLCEVDLVGIIGTTDITLPSTATVTLVSKTTTTVTLSASATDNVAVDQYNYFRGGTYIGTAAAGQNYVDTTASPGTNYSYTATAVDTSGNESAAQGAAVAVKTDSVAPTFSAQATSIGNGNRSWTHTVPAGPTQTVFAALVHTNGAAGNPTATIDGTPMTLVGTQGNGGNGGSVYVYRADGVGAGAHTIAMTTSESYASGLSVSYLGVNSQSAAVGVAGTSTIPTTAATAVTALDLFLSFFATKTSAAARTGTVRAAADNQYAFGRVVEGTGATPQTNSLTTTNDGYAVVSVKISG